MSKLIKDLVAGDLVSVTTAVGKRTIATVAGVAKNETMFKTRAHAGAKYVVGAEVFMLMGLLSDLAVDTYTDTVDGEIWTTKIEDHS